MVFLLLVLIRKGVTMPRLFGLQYDFDKLSYLRSMAYLTQYNILINLSGVPLSSLTSTLCCLARYLGHISSVQHPPNIITFIAANSQFAVNLEILQGGDKVLNYCITVDFFENYRKNVIHFLYKYRDRSIFYQSLYLIVTVR